MTMCATQTTLPLSPHHSGLVPGQHCNPPRLTSRPHDSQLSHPQLPTEPNRAPQHPPIESVRCSHIPNPSALTALSTHRHLSCTTYEQPAPRTSPTPHRQCDSRRMRMRRFPSLIGELASPLSPSSPRVLCAYWLPNVRFPWNKERFPLEGVMGIRRRLLSKSSMRPFGDPQS